MSGIFLSKKRKQTAIPVTINAGILGSGQFMVRPLIYTEEYEKQIFKFQQEARDSARKLAMLEVEVQGIVDDGGIVSEELSAELVKLKAETKGADDAYGKLFMELIADWEVSAPKEDIIEVCGKTEAEVETYTWSYDPRYFADEYFERTNTRITIVDKKKEEMEPYIRSLFAEAGITGDDIDNLLRDAKQYKIPVCIEAMNLFTKLEGSNMNTILLEAIRKIPLSTTVSGSKK